MSRNPSGGQAPRSPTPVGSTLLEGCFLPAPSPTLLHLLPFLPLPSMSPPSSSRTSHTAPSGGDRDFIVSG